ncbi:MAG: oligosaccharide flippase family protein [Paucibacter sp.]|nr:oligosaccharide flippase family protein [Roseateles sp.]
MSDFRRAFLINLGSSTAGALVQLALAMVLARLLTPAELGRFAIAAALAGAAHALRDLGVFGYVQREASLSRAQLAGCLGLSCLGNWGAALLLLASGDHLLAILALGFLPLPLTGLIAALMHRELAAARLAAVARIGAGMHAAVALGLAWAGWGAYALAWAALANTLACGVAYWAWRPSGLPLRPTRSHWPEILRLARGSVPAEALTALNAALPSALLGRLGAPVLVGLFGRAQAAAGLPLALSGNALSFGALPRLARAHHAGDPLAAQLDRASCLLSGALWPLLAWICIFGEPLIVVLFGAAWREAATALPWLAGIAALQLLMRYDAAALNAVGRPGAVAALQATALALRASLCVLLFDGSLRSFAQALLLAELALLPLQLRLRRPWGLGSWFGAWRLSLWTTAAAALPALLVPQPLPGLIAGTLTWGLSLVLLGHPLAEEMYQLPRLFMTMRK